MQNIPISAPDAVLLFGMAATYALGVCCGLAIKFVGSRESKHGSLVVVSEDPKPSWERVQ